MNEKFRQRGSGSCFSTTFFKSNEESALRKLCHLPKKISSYYTLNNEREGYCSPSKQCVLWQRCNRASDLVRGNLPSQFDGRVYIQGKNSLCLMPQQPSGQGALIEIGKDNKLFALGILAEADGLSIAVPDLQTSSFLSTAPLGKTLLYLKKQANGST